MEYPSNVRGEVVGNNMIFDLRRHSIIARQYQTMRLQKISSIAKSEPLSIVSDDGILSLNFKDFQKIYQTICEQVMKEGPNFLIELERGRRQEAEKRLISYETSRGTSTLELVNVISDYGCLNLNEHAPRTFVKAFPELKERVLALLIPSSGKSYYHDTYLALVELAEDYHYTTNFSTNLENFKGFIRKYGFLSLNDTTMGKLEDSSEIVSILSGMRRPNAREVREEIFFSSFLMRLNREKTLEQIYLEANRRPFVKEICEFVAVGGDYDEKNREIRSKMYKQLRDRMRIFDLDLGKTTLEELCLYDKNVGV